MTVKKILTIGFELADDDSEYCEFNSDLSLLDWDIILYKPNIRLYIDKAIETFQGRPCLSDYNSFKLKSHSEHWRREIRSAVESGKFVVVYLSELTEICIDTGERKFSGTGRNQKTTRIVADYDNYLSIPISLNPVATKGKEIKLTSKNSELISAYWQEFSSVSSYKVIIDFELPPCLVTKHGDRSVGAVIRSKNSNGALICLPDIDFYPKHFINKGEWTNEAQQFASRLIKSMVSIEKALRIEGENTPEPDWSKDEKYKLKDETYAVEYLLQIEKKLELILSEKEQILDKIKDLARIRNLLYEKGKPLELAILEALSILGFCVSQYEDGKSEFDVVFESDEGRLIGEAEGKDSKAINIDKLRQLALNIHEDLEREEIKNPAKSVLFGNAYRLLPVDDREEPFTDKCLTAALTSSTALVSTPDLFLVAKYLKDHPDDKYAMQCRRTILESVGRVKFPALPKHRETKVSVRGNNKDTTPKKGTTKTRKPD